MKKSDVINHSDRAAIEYGLARGTPVRQLARKYGLSIDSLYRFRAKMSPQLRAQHMAKRLKASADLDKLRVEESESILSNLAQQRVRLWGLQDAAIEAGDRREAAYIGDVILRTVKLASAYLGEFSKHEVHTNVNVMISEGYLRLRSRMMQALAPFPEARRAIATTLQELEAKAAEEAKPEPTIIEGVAVEVEGEPAHA
jgi:hypothetical protein